MELVATKDNPIPPGGAATAVRSSDGRLLRAASWSPGHRTRGTVALIQGRAEYIEKYFETISELLGRGFKVVTFDWRGQGGSERELANARKGHIDDFSLYRRDLDAFIHQIVEFLCPKPHFAIAHSMGGAILLEHAHSGHTPFQRIVLTAPMIDIERLPFPALARTLADTLDMLGLGAMFIPGGTGTSLVEHEFRANNLTSDPARLARNAGVLKEAPRLGVGDPTISWANAAFRLMSQFAEPSYGRDLRTPALLFSCGRDSIVSSRAIESFAQRLPLANHLAVPGARHELLMERDELREQFWEAFDAFIPGTAGAERASGT